ncbi:MAG: DNA polymerase-3 subunit delta' [Bradymonadia bacterium]|jgi:DNA polymerase-3 subunit delta'
MTFDAIEGQDLAITALRRAVRDGRLHHAYLFAGPDGVGKALCGRALAMTLLCDALRDASGCGTCRSCERVVANEHPDFHRLARGTKPDGRPEAQIKIAQVRELQKALSFKSYEAGRRVVIIEEAERMNPSTANALLKTLEEPGEGTHFIVVSAQQHQLLPTIISRCQKVRFAPLPRAMVAHHLARLLSIDAAEADLLAGLAQGSIGKGRALHDSAVNIAALGDGNLLEQRRALIERVDDPNGLNAVPALMDLADGLARAKTELPHVFHLMRTWYRDLLWTQRGMPATQLVHRDLTDRLNARAPTLTQAQILVRIELINETEHAIMVRSGSARLFMERLLLGLVGAREVMAA